MLKGVTPVFTIPEIEERSPFGPWQPLALRLISLMNRLAEVPTSARRAAGFSYCPHLLKALRDRTLWLGAQEDNNLDVVVHRMLRYREPILSNKPDGDSWAVVFMLPRLINIHPDVTVENKVRHRISMGASFGGTFLPGHLNDELMPGVLHLPVAERVLLPVVLTRPLVAEDDGFIRECEDPKEKALAREVYRNKHGKYPD